MIHEYSWFDEDFLNIFKWMIIFMFIWSPGSFVAFNKCMFDTQKSPCGHINSAFLIGST